MPSVTTTRNLLILACTEVETHWRGVLVANGAAQMSERLITSQYVKLNNAMKLDHYAVAFTNYPWLEPFKPYDGWGSTGRPTQELPWYDAYNATKHDRENSFSRATLRYVFEAISATAILVVAQYELLESFGQNSELRSIFQFTSFPSWLNSEVYILPSDGLSGEWRPVNFPF